MYMQRKDRRISSWDESEIKFPSCTVQGYFYLHGKKMMGATEDKGSVVQPDDLAAKP